MQQSNQGNAEGTKFTGGNGPGDAASFVEVEMAVNGLENDSFQGPSRLTSRTVLSVLAVNVIYFAHLVNLVGAGAQSQVIAASVGSPGNAVWILGPITIMTVALGPVVSQAAEYWGRRWFLVIMSLLGGVGCLVVALANSIGMVIAGFTIAGVAYGTQPLLHAVTSEVIPRRWRGWGQATNMISNSLGSAVALLVGGALNRSSDATSKSFRYFYYMTMSFFVLGAILCYLVYHPPRTEKQSLPLREKLSKLDWLGYGFLASGLTLFCVALSWTNNPYPWSDPHVLATFIIGVVVLLGFAVYEIRFKKDGMFHHDLFRFSGNRNFAICLLCVFTEGAAFFAVNAYLVYQVTVIYEGDALLAGLHYVMAFIAAGIGASFAGWYCAKTRRTRWITCFAFGIFLLFFILMATASRSSRNPLWFFPVLMGVALGMTLTTLVTIAQLSTPPDSIALGTGLMLSFRAVGGAIGLTSYHALFKYKMSYLGQNVASSLLSAGLSPKYVGQFISALSAHDSEALAKIPGVNGTIIQQGTVALKETFLGSFRTVWITAACFVSLPFILAFFLVDNEKEFNMHVDAPLELEKGQTL